MFVMYDSIRYMLFQQQVFSAQIMIFQFSKIFNPNPKKIN